MNHKGGDPNVQRAAKISQYQECDYISYNITDVYF